ncbi:MAG: S-layer homology domain-containing protein [Eubacteriales bacterium]|nr:S-layer homology domain-containing protein [Eubacteriales bacterium]MDD3864354.1 S-layer homology domain-containing protein [Eubacteriales bacterium]
MKRRFYSSIAWVLVLMMVAGFSPVYAVGSDFSGTVAKTVPLPDVITFTAADFTELYKRDIDTMDAVVITGADPDFGALKLEEESALGERIDMEDIQDGVLTFVPTDTGVVSYTVTAYAFDEEEPAGAATLTVTVEESTDAGNAEYTVDENMPIRLSSVYFAEVFRGANGRELSYVKFDIPGADKGVLYLDYTSAVLFEARITATERYYADTYPGISRITFVPAEDFSGTISIPYTGYAADDSAYWGMLTIHVRDASAEEIAYSTEAEEAVSFDAEDFDEVCLEMTGDELSYVIFTLPAPSHGKLYYNYRSATDYDALVLTNAKYFNSAEPGLSGVDFLPAVDVTGTVRILYKGYSVEGESYNGTVAVTVDAAEEEEDEEEEVPEESEHFRDVGKNIAWAAEAIDYLYEEGILLGDGAGYYNPRASISRGDFMMMLSRAFDLDTAFEDNFTDVDKDDYYYKAVGAAKKFGITKGSNGKFNPRSALSRQDAMVLILRALEAADIDLEEGAEEVLTPFKDQHKISDYAKDAFQAMVRAGIIKGSGKFLNPNSSVSRAEIAVILYRILTL